MEIVFREPSAAFTKGNAQRPHRLRFCIRYEYPIGRRRVNNPEHHIAGAPAAFHRICNELRTFLSDELTPLTPTPTLPPIFGGLSPAQMTSKL